MPESRDTEGLPKEAPWPVRRGLTASCSACMILITTSVPATIPPRGTGSQVRRIIVCGSRRWRDRDAVIRRLAAIEPPLDDVVIVHGDAAGADRIAHQEAEKLGLLVEPRPADWETHGRRAGYLRNVEMAAAGAELCIAFWDGRSKGTSMMIDIAKRSRIPVEIVWPGRFRVVRVPTDSRVATGEGQMMPRRRPRTRYVR